MSQLLGYPDLPNLKLTNQFACVSMLDWTTGVGNQR